MEREYRKFRKEEKGRSIRKGSFCKTRNRRLEKRKRANACTKGSNSGKRRRRERPGKRENGKTADSEDAERTELCAGAGRREHRKRIRKFCVKIKWRK